MKSPANPRPEKSSRFTLPDAPLMSLRRGTCTKGRLTGSSSLKAPFLWPYIVQTGNSSGNLSLMKRKSKPSPSHRTSGTDSLRFGGRMRRLSIACRKSLTAWMSIAFLSIIFPATGNLKADEKLFIPPQAKPIRVRLTTYHRNEDYWTRRLKSSSGYTLKEGVSVAVDPRIFPYGSKIYIEGVGIRKVHDTGTAVISKKASGGKLPIVDVFFMQKRCAEAFANSHRYARVWVIEKK
jgi:3D (Asp-Asp-Asp) domain-containing protein